MRKKISVAVAATMLTAMMPVTTFVVSADSYFADTRTVSYTTKWNNAQNGTGYTTAENAANYKFTVGTETFSLLDVKDSSSSKYFVITDDKVADFAFYANTDVTNYFEVVSGSGDAHAKKYPSWTLNGEYFQKGWWYQNWTGIGSTIRNYIDFSHVWTCEEAYANSEYTITAGIAYPSASEIVTYADRFMLSTASPFVIRTLRNQESSARVGRINIPNSTNWQYQAYVLGDSATWLGVRPVFWLNDQFFAEVAVDLSTAGEAVKQEIKKVGYETLKEKGTYSDNDLYDLFRIVPTGGEYFADTRTVSYTTKWNNAQNGTGYTTSDNAAKYKFTVGTETFSLLDVKDNSNSKYFVITDSNVANFAFYANTDVTNYFEIVSGSGDNHAKKYPSWALNGEYFQKGWWYQNWTGIGSTVRNYIDFSHVWTCEEAYANSEYTITAGIAYPSASEIVTYADRFMLSTASPFVIRTLRNQESSARVGRINIPNSTNWQYQAYVLGDSATWLGVRPVFWLNDQFFAEVAVDLSTAGEAVKQEVRKIGYDNLLSIYSKTDLDTYLFDISLIPTASVRFTDGSGNNLASMNGITSVNVTTDLLTSVPGINAYAILAVYKSDGTLEKCDINHLQSTTEEINNFTMSLTGLSNDTGRSAKFMIWNDLDRTIWRLSDFVSLSE